MNIDDLKKSAEKITLSEDAKERIIQKCDELAKSGNIQTKSGGDEEFTEHVFTVEHYKPRRLAKITAGLAACAVIAASAGLTMKLMKNQPKSASSPSSIAAADTTSALNDNIPEELTKVLNNDFTNFLGVYLSEYQRDKIRELFSNAEYSLADEFKDEDADFIEYTDSEFTYRVGVYKDLICYRCDSIDDTEFAALKGYAISKDIEGNTHTQEVTAVADEPGLKYRNYFRVSKDFYEEYRAILNMPFETLLGRDFYINTPGDLSAEQQDEIRAYLRRINAEPMVTRHLMSRNTLPEPEPESAALTYQDGDTNIRICIGENSVKCYSFTTYDIEEYGIIEREFNDITDEDLRSEILDIFMNSEDKKIQEEAAKQKEEASRAQEQEKQRKETEEQSKDSAILNLNGLFADDMHVGWFPYGDDIGRGVTNEVREKLFSKLSHLRIEPGDISKLDENSDKAVVVYGSTTDNSKSLSVIIFGNQIVINSKESKDQCFKTDDEFLYEDIMALLEGESKDRLLAPYYPPAEGMCEYNGISAKTLSVDRLNEIAEKINTQKWYPVNSRPLTQECVHIKVYSNLDSHTMLNIYLDGGYVYIGENSGTTAESQKLMSVYCCYNDNFSDQIIEMLESE